MGLGQGRDLPLVEVCARNHAIAANLHTFVVVKSKSPLRADAAVKMSRETPQDADQQRCFTALANPELRMFNIANSLNSQLLRFIEVMEQALCKTDIRDIQMMRPGDDFGSAIYNLALEDCVGRRLLIALDVGVHCFPYRYFNHYN